MPRSLLNGRNQTSKTELVAPEVILPSGYSIRVQGPCIHLDGWLIILSYSEHGRHEEVAAFDYEDPEAIESVAAEHQVRTMLNGGPDRSFLV